MNGMKPIVIYVRNIDMADQKEVTVSTPSNIAGTQTVSEFSSTEYSGTAGDFDNVTVTYDSATSKWTMVVNKNGSDYTYKDMGSGTDVNGLYAKDGIAANGLANVVDAP